MIAYDQMPEHEFEGAHGLPEPLPRSEKMLWQGAPDWRALARTAMHVRLFAIYFAVLMAWRAVTVLSNGGSVGDAAVALAWLLPLALAALGLLTLLAWLTARTTVYTITDRRLVMRVGIVLSITFNLPYSQIESAALRLTTQDSGDISLLPNKSCNIAYLNLWPHARPMHFARSQPMLRGLADARGVGAVLAQALAASAGLQSTGVSAALPSAALPEAIAASARQRHPVAA